MIQNGLNNRSNRRVATLVILLLSMLLSVGCSPVVTSEDVNASEVDPTKTPIATLSLDSGEVIKISLLPEIAPNTVNNFIALSQDGFYDGLTFHRVIKNFMIQGGDPMGNGMGGPGYSIKGEFNENGFSNGLKHTRGVLSMARTRDMDSAGSQFFIMHEDSETLDGKYASFGIVTEGLEVVDKIVEVPVNKDDKPLEDIVIKSITIELNGYVPEALETIK